MYVDGKQIIKKIFKKSIQRSDLDLDKKFR